MALANYCLRADLDEEMQLGAPSEDTRVSRAITDASRVIDSFCRVEPGTFAPQTLTKLFNVPGSGLTVRQPFSDNSKGWFAALSVPPLISVTSLLTDNDGDGVFETTWTSPTDYLLEPLNMETKRLVVINQDTGRFGFPQGQRRVQISGSWGITEDGITPEPIRRATLLLAMNYYRRPSTQQSGPQGLGGAAIHFGFLDPDVASIIWAVAGKYQQQWIGA